MLVEVTIYCQFIKLIKCSFFCCLFGWLIVISEIFQWFTGDFFCEILLVTFFYEIILWDSVGEILLVRFFWWDFLVRFFGEIFLVRFRCHFHLMSKTDLIGILVWRPFFQVTHQEIEQALNMSNKGWSKIQHFSLKNEIVPFLRFQSKKIDIA